MFAHVPGAHTGFDLTPAQAVLHGRLVARLHAAGTEAGAAGGCSLPSRARPRRPARPVKAAPGRPLADRPDAASGWERLLAGLPHVVPK